MLRFIRECFARVATYRNLKQYHESHPVSLWVSTVLEKIPVRKFIGTQLAGLTFVSAIVAPGASSLYSSYQAQNMPELEYIDASTLTQSLNQWPVGRIGITTYFSSGHPGLDLADPAGTPVSPIRSGKVVSVVKTPWIDYGNHILIEHNNDTQSLYAHLSRIFVREGQEVTKSMVIGTVGSTGHSTGNHLHLEIREKNIAVNPLENLPTLPTPAASQKMVAQK